jgi:RimJ/RimL family protein N-acetyltransferase
MITLRKVSDSDAQLLLELYASTREAELSMTPWSEEQKSAFVRMQFAAQAQAYSAQHPCATHEVICLDGRPVGRLYLDRQPDRFDILDITIAPAFRNAGIGSQVLKDILQDADQARAGVCIYVETFNRSLRLFERLGFRAAAGQDFYIRLERAPFTSS